MIDIALGDLLGYLGTFWCVANLLWGMFRNDAVRAVIYGIGCFAALIVALNVGGILNETTWSLFGMVVFGLHAIYNLAVRKVVWKGVMHAFLLGVSVLCFLGVV